MGAQPGRRRRPRLRAAPRAADAVTAIERLRESHPLAPALPVIRRLLVDDAADSGVVVAVSAADGTLLWVEGDPKARRKAEAMNFVPGADWSERGVGTNAPGTALALDRELQIRGSEHFSRIVQPWSCTAAPVHDPATGALLGAIDLTGGSQVACIADAGPGPRHRASPSRTIWRCCGWPASAPSPPRAGPTWSCSAATGRAG